MTDATVYLDYNATAPVKPAVRMAMAEALEVGGNPSSVHRYGRLARRMVEDARAAVGQAVGARANDVTFTSGGTEADALALNGLEGYTVLVSEIEHPAVLEAAPEAQRLPVTPDGVIDLEALRRVLETLDGKALVSVMLANNETGVLQPLTAVVDLVKEFDGLVHCDAVQAFGKVPVNMALLGVDLLSLSAHKIGGPQGIGALVIRPGLALKPVQKGGGQERYLRGGTENVPGIVGFGKAAHEINLAEAEKLAVMRDDLERRIKALSPQTIILGEGAERLPNTSCFTMPGVAAETQVMSLDLAGVAVSSGSACSSGKVGTSHVLAAMGLTGEDAKCALRVSLGWGTEPAHIDRLVAAWSELFERAAPKQRLDSPAI